MLDIVQERASLTKEGLMGVLAFWLHTRQQKPHTILHLLLDYGFGRQDLA